MSYAAMMVHLDVDRDSEQRVQLTLDLANRFEASLIGIAGLALRPAFLAGSVVVFAEPSPGDLRQATASLDEMGKKFLIQGRDLKHVEWRFALEPPSELLAREARAADLVIVGAGTETTIGTISLTQGSFCCGPDGRSWWSPISPIRSRCVAW